MVSEVIKVYTTAEKQKQQEQQRARARAGAKEARAGSSLTPEQLARSEDDIKASTPPEGIENVRRRNLKLGDIYAPHDLGPTKFVINEGFNYDRFDLLRLNPLDHYKVSPLTIFPPPLPIPSHPIQSNPDAKRRRKPSPG